MSHHDEQTLLSPKIKKDCDDHHSKSKDIIVLNDNQPPKKKDQDNRPHYQATTRVQEDGPSRRRTTARPTCSRQTTFGGDIELIKFLLENNQQLRETLLDLTKRFPINSTNYKDHESFTSRSFGRQNRTKVNPPPLAQKKKKKAGRQRTLPQEGSHRCRKLGRQTTGIRISEGECLS